MRKLHRQIGWNTCFPQLNHPTAKPAAQLLELEAGESLFREGGPCQHFIVVLEGELKIRRISHDGHEITLYHLRAGEVCAMTLACLLAQRHYHAEARAEAVSRVALFPRAAFMQEFARSERFQQLVFEALEHSTTSLLNLLEDIAFVAVDVRLANWLSQHIQHRRELHLTHHELAAELGTAREVVSRILKRFERNRWLKLHRGRIEVLNRAAIENFAREASI